MRGRERTVLVALMLGLLIPVAGAVTWNIQQITVFPINASQGSSIVVAANVSDDQGKPVNPDRCSEINILYEYPFGATRQPMSYVDKTPSWFINGSLSTVSGGDNVTVLAGGQCNGVDATTITQTETFTANGNISVEFLTDLSGEFASGGVITVEWNATNISGIGGGDPAFEPGANLSYQFYTLSGTINRTGSVQDGDIGIKSDHFEAQVQLPGVGGMYILNVNATNTSMNIKHPYGGAAVPIRVSSDLSGTAHVRHTGDKCRDLSPLTCEKGARVNVSFFEEVEDANNVTVTVKGNGNEYDVFDLKRWNSSTWNGSFVVGEGFNTTTYGKQLDVVVNASNDLDFTVETLSVNVSGFKLIESTQPFVDQGRTIDLVAGPVTTFTELPVPRDNMSVINFSVRNTTDHYIFNRTLRKPFSDSNYDASQQLFVTGYDVPLNAPTGEYTVETVQRDIFGETSSRSYTFTVTQSDTVQDAITLTTVDGSDNTDELERDYTFAGNYTIPVTLNNTADVAASLDVFFTGDLPDTGSVFESLPTSFDAGESRTLHLNMSLDQEGVYDGDIEFYVHGDSVTNYNITLPTNLTVGKVCEAFAPTLCIHDTDLVHTFTAADTHHLTFDVESSQPVNLSVAPHTNLSGLIPSRNISLNASDRHTVNLSVPVSSADNGIYAGHLNVSSESTLFQLYTYLNISVTGGTGTGDGNDTDQGQESISVSAPTPNLGTFTAGESVPVHIQVTNTGSTTITELDVSSSNLSLFKLSSVDLAPGDQTTLEYTVAAPNLGGESTALITVESRGGATDSVEVTLTAYRNFTRSFDQLQQSIIELQNTLQNKTGDTAQIRSNLSTLTTLVEEGRQAAINGDYQLAQRKYAQATELHSQVNSAIRSLSDKGDGGGGGSLPVIPIVVFLVILLVVGVILYLSLVPEEEGEPDFSGPPPGQRPGYQ